MTENGNYRSSRCNAAAPCK